jgi:nitroreductase/NAD-dependent dihydropyrimidine dehydrogenase PreA subunit
VGEYIMMKVDKEKCIGCSLCVNDCIVRDINLVNGKANINNITCIKCGHCIAVCPRNAVSTNEYKMEDVKEYNKEEFEVNEENLLNFIKFRRSIRNFKDKDVENEKLQKIIEAGRFTQTGSNSQDVSYVVIKNGIDKLREMILESLSQMGQELLNNLNEETIKFKTYAEMWVKMYEDYKVNPKKGDRVFFNAPAVVLVISNSQVNGALASSNMELMTNALGLGTFFSGFFIRAAQGNKKIMDYLGLDESKQIVTCMVIGYPNIKYLRTTPRKIAEISWM